MAPRAAPSRAPFAHYGAIPNIARPTNSIAGAPYGGVAGFAVYIDLPRLGRALGDVNLRSGPGAKAVSMAINRGVDRVFTRLKRFIVGWTGLSATTVAAGMRKRRAWPSHLQGAVVIQARHHKIDSVFNAAWGGPSTAGGTHDAWNNPQLAKGSFMVKGVLKTRTTAARFPIKSLWGPNPAREVMRHRAQAEAMLLDQVRTVVVPEIARQVDREFKRVKAKFGL